MDATRQHHRSRPFANRWQAGALLAEWLSPFAGRPDVVVLALPRGGVPVGYEIAVGLGAPLDVLVVRRLTLPGYPDVTVGAVASGGVRMLDEAVLERHGITPSAMGEALDAESQELRRREDTYRGGPKPLADVAGKTVILVDDGAFTDAAIRAALLALKCLNPAEVVVAVPVAAAEAWEGLLTVADELACIHTPDRLAAVAECYDDFPLTPDDEVRGILDYDRIVVRRRDRGAA